MTLLHDLKLAVRGFARTPAFTVIAVLTLAIGIGANSAIFSVVDGVVLRALPYPRSDELVLLEQLRPDKQPSGGISWPDFVDWRKETEVFAEVAGWHGDSVVLTRAGEPPTRLDGLAVTANFFTALGVRPALGRGFAPGEDVAGKNHVAVITHAAWQKRFGGDPQVVGRTVSFDDTPYTIVGVTGRDFKFVVEAGDIDVFTAKPRAFDLQLGELRNARYMNALARLAPGVSLATAQGRMGALAAAHAKAYPDSNTGRDVRVTQLHERITRDVRPALLILLGAVGFVLLIACANVANLLLARASARHRELAIRVALGAGRGRVVRQLLTESVLLAVAGGALGVLLAIWGLEALRGMLPAELGKFSGLAIDARVVAFTAAVALLTGVAFGLYPALQASRQDPGEALKEAGARATSHAGRQRARNTLVAMEIGAATLLLVGAALMLRSFDRVTSVDPGFDPDDLMTATLVLPDTRYREPEKQAQLYRDLRRALAALPGAEGVAVTTPMPFSQVGINSTFSIAGAPPLPPGTYNVAANIAISPEYFKVMRVPLRAGRAFADSDDLANAPPVVIVNETLARQYFEGESPIGKRLVTGRGPRQSEAEIVGVAADIRATGLETETTPAIYAPFPQRPFALLQFAVRTRATAGLAESLQRAIATVDPGQPLGELQTMHQAMRDNLAKRRLNTVLLALFAGVAMLLALIGVYGVMSYTVTQRVPEIGIRMALGARPGDVTRMVVGQGFVLALIGVAVGLIAAFGLARLAESELYGVSPSDPVSYVVIAALLLAVAALASWLPARRAARVDPMIALRSE
jgi:putative ABC transport system permease protein